MRTGLKVASLILVLGMLLAGMGPVLAAPQDSTPVANSAAAIYVARVKGFINATLNLITMYNITLNNSLQAKINISLQLIGWAESNLTINETLAVQLATRASIEFAPVADAVWRSLPQDVKDELRAKEMEKIVSARLELMKKIQVKIRIVENFTGVNMSQLLISINNTIIKLNLAKQEIQNGNLSKAKQIMTQAMKESRKEIMIAYKETYNAMRKTVAFNVLVLKLVGHVYTLENAINMTLQSINQTSDENLTQVLTGLSNRNKALLRMAERLAENYPLPNPSDPIYNGILTIIAGLNTSQIYLELAVNASISGNTTWVITNLSLALETLNNTLANVTQVRLPLHIEKKIEKTLQHMERLREAREKALNHSYAAISSMLDRKMNNLQELYQKYEDGKIPAWKLRIIFKTEKIELQRLKLSLPPDAPNWLIEKIDNILSWIDEHTP